MDTKYDFLFVVLFDVDKSNIFAIYTVYYMPFLIIYFSPFCFIVNFVMAF